uniref:dihydrolipoyl dehydrogenase n=1 Tax=Marinobacterium profundum TaxID=1714300 RepID=UPI00082BEE42|nr:dihydrolipoyl dehydrogenase [Marinobacterium profundum]
MKKIDVEIPDIGDFTDVPVIEISVGVGDIVKADDPILILESDKAVIDIPAPVSGKVVAILVSKGDRVSQGSIVLHIEGDADAASATPISEPVTTSGGAPAPQQGVDLSQANYQADLLVLGAGPGGYTAAFRAADLGLKVTLIERWSTLGGVCLNVGCIPSKALLHAAKVINDADEMTSHGITFSKPAVDIDNLRHWKDEVVGKLTGGLNSLAKRRKVDVVHGTGVFESSNLVRVSGEDGEKMIAFKQAIIACGSEPMRLPFLPEDDRIIDSTGALALADIPKRMLVLGGGIIGLEMAQVYRALGASITLVELMDQIIPGADKDIVTPLMKSIEKRYDNVLLNTKVIKVEASKISLQVTFEGPNGVFELEFDKILSAVGRKPNSALINTDTAGVVVDERGFIVVDKQMRTSQSHIFAIGDIVGQPMLAHKAVHEGKVAAENAAGHNSVFDALVIPSVAYTDPEVAWVGLTENEAKSKDIDYKRAAYPWAASGRSLSMGRQEGMSKILFDPETKRVLGAGLVGPNAGELLAEVALAIEMGADSEDLSLTIHPHPTLSETIALSAEIFEGIITDL